MSFWTALVAIIGIIAITQIIKARHGGSARLAKRDEADMAQSKAREAELEDEIKQLRERLQVLERITVDDRRANEVANEIESLRDK